jgi:hypothetical protein
MLGRPRMSIDECIDAKFITSKPEIFRKRHRASIKGNIRGWFDPEERARAMKEAIKGQGTSGGCTSRRCT